MGGRWRLFSCPLCLFLGASKEGEMWIVCASVFPFLISWVLRDSLAAMSSCFCSLTLGLQLHGYDFCIYESVTIGSLGVGQFCIALGSFLEAHLRTCSLRSSTNSVNFEFPALNPFLLGIPRGLYTFWVEPWLLDPSSGLYSTYSWT